MNRSDDSVHRFGFSPEPSKEPITHGGKRIDLDWRAQFDAAVVATGEGLEDIGQKLAQALVHPFVDISGSKRHAAFEPAHSAEAAHSAEVVERFQIPVGRQDRAPPSTSVSATGGRKAKDGHAIPFHCAVHGLAGE